jgi:hypothetical protein
MVFFCVLHRQCHQTIAKLFAIHGQLKSHFILHGSQIQRIARLLKIRNINLVPVPGVENIINKFGCYLLMISWSFTYFLLNG